MVQRTNARLRTENTVEVGGRGGEGLTQDSEQKTQLKLGGEEQGLTQDSVQKTQLKLGGEEEKTNTNFLSMGGKEDRRRAVQS